MTGIIILLLNSANGAGIMKWCYVILFLLLSACSQRSYYESIQTNQRNECERLIGLQREECFKHLGPDYQTYERQRQELLTEEKE